MKKFLFHILKEKRYFRLVSKLFFWGYDTGVLKNKPEFEVHYFVRRVIKPGYHILDIGANFGYYAKIFSRLTGPRGKVTCIEPVSLFRKILYYNLKRAKNIEILPYALGEMHDTKISMGIPVGHSVYRHGLTKVLTGDSEKVYEQEAIMKDPEILFSDINQLDYIKCDVEGYEIHIIPRMSSLIEKFKPVIQIETEGENKKKIITMLSSIGYKAYWIKASQPVELNSVDDYSFGDLMFVHPENEIKF